MGSARGKHPVSPLATLAACLAVSTLAGCYHPNVSDGSFKCGPMTGKQCPDGFLCDKSDGVCRRMARDGGTDKGDAPADVRDAMEVMDAMDAGCFMPKANCDPSDAGATCDPWCQSGCAGCRQKCSVNSVGVLTCNDIVVVPSTPMRTELQSCNILNVSNPSTQSDACAPGLVCLEDACGGDGFGRCYKFCRDDNDCPNSQCSKTLNGSGWRTCDVPNADSCNPTQQNSGCSGAQACYIAISRPTHTVCDCPGDKGSNVECTGSRSCFAGLLCVDPNGNGPICLQVCQLSKNGTDCPGGTSGSCHPYSGNTGGTMTNATFGYCF